MFSERLVRLLSQVTICVKLEEPEVRIFVVSVWLIKISNCALYLPDSTVMSLQKPMEVSYKSEATQSVRFHDKNCRAVASTSTIMS